MERKRVDEPNGWDFTYLGGRTIENGKSHWPDCLTVWLDRQRALEVVAQIVTALQDGERDEIGISLCGELEESDEG